MRESRAPSPEVCRRPFPWSSVTIGVLFVLCAVLSSLLVFQSARLHREQERLAVANDTIEFARSEFSNADDEVARYRSAALGYYAEHGGTYTMPYDYSAGFEGYCKRHPIPAPLLDLGS